MATDEMVSSTKKRPAYPKPSCRMWIIDMYNTSKSAPSKIKVFIQMFLNTFLSLWSSVLHWSVYQSFFAVRKIYGHRQGRFGPHSWLPEVEGVGVDFWRFHRPLLFFPIYHIHEENLDTKLQSWDWARSNHKLCFCDLNQHKLSFCLFWVPCSCARAAGVIQLSWEHAIHFFQRPWLEQSWFLMSFEHSTVLLVNLRQDEVRE